MKWVDRMREPAGAVPPHLRRLLVWGGGGALVLAVGWSTWEEETATPPPEPNPAAAQAPPVPEVQVRARGSVQSTVRELDADEQRRALQDAERRLEEQKRQRALQTTVRTHLDDPAAGPPPHEILPAGEYPVDDIVAEEIRQLEARRRYESLRAPQIVRETEQREAPAVPARPVSEETAPPPERSGEPPPDPTDELLRRVLEEPERYAPLFGATPPPASPPGATVPPAAEPTAPPTGDTTTALVSPQDPEGWERIYEGSFLECVLLTQLRGDFAGPVAVMVAVDFHSRDRQRLLIPRGSRVLGSATSVAQWGQARLAVAFHRLILPDGRHASLEQFEGLNQVGETGLKDRVNHHYGSVFGAAAAVGLLSGLAMQNTTVFGPAGERIRAGTGAGLAQQGMAIMERFLNRLPTVTIRAGHRVRVWFASDVLVPRPSKAP